ncbi:MAG: BON domain-containing protein [Ilyomonas sp.]
MAYNDRNRSWSDRDDWNRDRNRYDDNDYNRFTGNNRRNYNERRNNDDNYRGNWDIERNDYNESRYNRTWNNRSDEDRRYDDRRMNSNRWNDYRDAPAMGTYTGYAGQMGPTEGVPGFGTGNDYDRDYNYRNRNYNRDHDNNYRRRNDRDWWDKASDEVSSWFGDEDAERRRERDKREDHRGKGPKNYKRSEDHIMEDVCVRLSEHPYIDASDIMVTVNGTEVTLSGTVDDKQTKRKAEDVADSISGVTDVHNQLHVRSASDRLNTTSNTNTTSENKTSAFSSNKNAVNLT